MVQESKHLDSLAAKLVETLGEIVAVIGDSLAEGAAARVGGMLPDFDAQQKRTAYQLEAIGRQVEGLSANARVLEDVSQANRMLGSEFYEERIIQPMVRGLFPIVDLLHDGMKKLESKQSRAKSTLRYLSALQVQVEQFLGTYGMETVSHETGDTFDPKTMKPLKQHPTDDPDLDGLVAESLQCGFRISERVLRLETVSLFRFENSEKSVSQEPVSDGKELKDERIGN